MRIRRRGRGGGSHHRPCDSVLFQDAQARRSLRVSRRRQFWCLEQDDDRPDAYSRCREVREEVQRDTLGARMDPSAPYTSHAVAWRDAGAFAFSSGHFQPRVHLGERSTGQRKPARTPSAGR